MSDHFRDLFRDRARSITVPPRNLSGVIGSGRKRLLRRRVVSVSSTVVSVALLAAALTQIDSRQDRSPIASEVRLAVVERVPLDAGESGATDFARDLTYGFGYIWALHAHDTKLQRIDPGTNEADRVITLSEESRDQASFWDVGVGFDLLWITNPRAGEVIGVDPASEKIVARIQGVGRPLGVVAAQEALWIHSGGSLDEEVLYRVNPKTLEITGSLGMGSECCVSGIVESGGYLWVSHSDVPNAPRGEAGDGDDEVFDLTNEIRKIDPRDPAIVDRIPLEGDTYRPGDTVLGGLTAVEGYLWVARPDAGFVDRVDSGSGRVDSIDLGTSMRPNALIYFEGRVWAWDLNGSLAVPIDPISLEVGEGSDVKEIIGSGPIEGAASLWVGSQSEDVDEAHSILRIDTTEPAPQPTPSEPEEKATPKPEGSEIVEELTEQEQAEVFAFRALADTGLMNPFGKRSYNFTYLDDTTQTDDGWRVGFAASDCEPRDETFTCRGLSGEGSDGNALTDTFMIIALHEGQWHVVDVEGNMLADERERVVGYTLPQREEPSHWEFPAVGVWPSDDGVFIEMVALWVGAYPTTAPGSVCEVQALNGNDVPVGEPRLSYEEPPNRSFERAGGVRGTEIEPSSDVERVVVVCRQYTGRGWEVASDPQIVGSPGQVSGAAAKLTWRGDEGITTAAVCRATLVDEAGDEVWEGSGRVEPLWRPNELKDYPYHAEVFVSTRGEPVDAEAVGEFTCQSE